MASIASHPLFIRLHHNRSLLFPLAFISLLLVISGAACRRGCWICC